MPTATDLVTDLPADFEVFGQAVATSMADLLGGTSGQVLAKNSNTDMDFVWVTSDDANAIQNTIVDAKGDLIAASAADTPARLAVGADYTVLQALTSATNGLQYVGGWTSYTPVMGVVSGTAPTIGNGTLQGGYRRIGSVVDFWISQTFQSTSTFGSGTYTFSLPVAASSSEFTFGFNVSILDAGVQWYEGWYGSGTTYGYTDKFVIQNPAKTAQATNTSPFTFAAGDGFRVYGSYRVVA